VEFGECTTNTTWTETLAWNTTVNLYKRYATTAYDKTNLSILSIISLSDPLPRPLNASDFKELYTIVLGDIPDQKNSSTSIILSTSAVTYTVQFGLGWALRLYQSLFSTYTDGGLSLLRSLIAMALQFSTQTNQMIGSLDIEPDTRVIATMATTSYRARGQLWTVWVFGVLPFSLTLWSIGCLVGIYLWGPDTPNTSLFPEIDVISKSNHPVQRGYQETGRLDESLEDISSLTRTSGLGNGMSAAVVEHLSKRKIYCRSYEAPNNREIIVLVTERSQLQGLKPHRKYS
jgi:hypothetical protein